MLLPILPINLILGVLSTPPTAKDTVVRYTLVRLMRLSGQTRCDWMVKQMRLRTIPSKAREGANKQVISSQADSLIKISRIWADYFSHQQLESAYLGRFFAISGVIPGF